MEPTPSSAALLVLDMQPAMLPPDAAFVARVGQAIAHARAHAIPVLYVVVGYRPGAPECAPRYRSHLREVDMTQFMQIVPALAPQPGELTVVKRRIGAFIGSDLEVVLRSLHIRHLVLAGFSTSGAVLSTVCAAADQDYELTVLADGCLDPDPEVHHVLVNKFFPHRATVLPVADWAADSN